MEIRLLGPVEVWAGGQQVDVGPPQRRLVLAALAVDANGLTADALMERVWGDSVPDGARPALHVQISRIRQVLAEAVAAEAVAAESAESAVEPGAAEPSGAEPGSAEPGGAEPGAAEPGAAEPAAAEASGAEPGGAEPGGAKPGGAKPGGAEPGGAEPGGAAADPPAAIVRRGGGYRLELPADAVDLRRFHRLAAAARDPQVAEPQRARMLREALELWRGPALADLTGDWAGRMRDHLARERLDVTASWAEAELAVGRHAAVIGPVRELLVEHPTVEPLIGVLMRALVAAGRTAEALEAYATATKQLASELGTAPGLALRTLHETILRADVDPHRPGGSAAASGPPARPVPLQLPADVYAFTGRAAELAELDGVLDREDAVGTAVVISAVSGTAGVGKTALAVRWAHRVRHRFPDGQLYVNLRGYDPAQPVSPADALVGFLTALGVAGQDIPLELADRAARYRSEVADRRLLVVLDNASAAEQVRPLLPGTSSCLVLVTSRDSLAALVSREGARRLDLDLLPLPDAVGLLRTLLGDRVDAEPDAAAALARQCARLPLALRVAAERAAAHPGVPLSRLVAQLTDLQQRLDLLDADGDDRAAVRGVFSWSYQHLPADAALLFRLLGLHPADDFDAYAAAALADTTLAHAERLLGILARARLLQAPARPAGDGSDAEAEGRAGGGDPPAGARPGRRYGMHDLLRAYAGDLGTSRDTDGERRAAQTRLLDHYLATAAAAMDAWYPAERHRRPRIDPPATPAPELADAEAGWAWLEAERPTLVAICAHAAEQGRAGYTSRLAGTLFRYLQSGGYYLLALTVHGHAQRATHRAGDRSGEAWAVFGLGFGHEGLGRFGPAADHLQRAAEMFRAVGDTVGEARSMGGLGLIDMQLGRYPPATDHLRQAVALFQRAGDRVGEADARNGLGTVEYLGGRYESAADSYRQAAALYRQLDDDGGEAGALTGLGNIDMRLGRLEQALEHHQRALTLARRAGFRQSEGVALTNLGDIQSKLGRHQQAAELHEQALVVFRESGDRTNEASALNSLGVARHGTGDHDDARAQHAAALAVAADIGHKDEAAHAHDGLARAYHAVGDLDQARDHWDRALALYTELGEPEAEDVRAHLAELTE